MYTYKHFYNNDLLSKFGGGRGIRTPGTLPGTVVFKTTAIDHSAIPPAFARAFRLPSTSFGGHVASVHHSTCLGAAGPQDSFGKRRSRAPAGRPLVATFVPAGSHDGPALYSPASI